MDKCVRHFTEGSYISLPECSFEYMFLIRLWYICLFLFLGLCVNTHNSQHMFFTFVHDGPMEHFLFYCPSGSKVMPPVMMLAVRVDVIEEASVINSFCNIICCEN